VSVVDRVYATALFDAAKEQGKLQPVREDFGDFVAMLDEVPELDQLLKNPELNPKAKVDALDAILGGVEPLVRNFLLLTVEKQRANRLREINREFERLVAQEERRLSVELTTAFELSDDEAQQIVGQIERASGRPVDATRSVDPGLIGGIVLQAGSMRVDASVRARLEKLRRELTTAR
jgi:F-type H+-transporting ATPase subunit delta